MSTADEPGVTVDGDTRPLSLARAHRDELLRRHLAWAAEVAAIERAHGLDGLTEQEAAAELGVSRSLIALAVAREELPTFQTHDRRLTIRRPDLHAWAMAKGIDWLRRRADRAAPLGLLDLAPDAD